MCDWPKKIAVVVSILLGLSSCSYVTPEAENPTPGLEKSSTTAVVQDGRLSIRKSFFGIEINQETNRISYKEKNWLCGWAPVTQSGRWKGAGGLTATPYRSRHCNIRFRISADGSNLEAREMDVDSLEDVDQWPLLFTIPILQHYFYEKDVDSRGRELNRYRKVSDRKNWKLSPIMDLDLKRIMFHNHNKRPYGTWISQILTDVFDIEWEKKDGKNFLAFNATSVHPWYGSSVQHVMRFNFLEFQDNPKFKVTPYYKDTAKHMNILHILGGSPDGFTQVNYAAHWDVSKPVEFCLNGFDQARPEYRNIGNDVIEAMNEGFVKAKIIKKGQKAFVASKRKMKYQYDLRCPSITWVDDPHLAFRAPLGIGLVNANVRTGEILWGGAVVWGGLIDYIVNRDSESVSDAMARNTNEMLNELESLKHNPYYEDVQDHLGLHKSKLGFKNLKEIIKEQQDPNLRLSDSLKDFFNKKNLDTIYSEAVVGSADNSDLSEEQIQARNESFKLWLSRLKDNIQAQEYQESLSNMKQIDSLSAAYAEIFAFDLTESGHYIQQIEKHSNFGVTVPYTDAETSKRALISSEVANEQRDREFVKYFQENHQGHEDLDNRVENHYYAWTSSLAGKSPLDKIKAAQSVIKNVTLHELGHVVGLGHQFEGNRLPERGTVPEAIYKDLKEKSVKRFNYTSIMDYMSGHTEVALPYDDVKIQYQDFLTLSYLYSQKYSTYHPGDKEFKLFSVPANGVIPSTTNHDGRNYVTTYMPQCSDMDAWLATSPYCRRWDRGHDAPTIVEENFNEFTDSLISRMNSFSDATGANPWMANYRLWSATYNLMNHNRTFYDNLRYLLHMNETWADSFAKMKEEPKSLIEFSKACIDPNLAPESSKKLFATMSLQKVAQPGEDIRLSVRQSEFDFDQILKTYESVTQDLNVRALNDQEYDELENRMYEKGIAFTEVQRLCRAVKKSLGYTKTLLSFNGPDHTIVNFDKTVVPTGLRGGNAKTDYSRLFGTYEQLGLLPIKLATMDVLTSTASTMRWGWWRVPKPQYNSSNHGKYGYFSLYPEEFTDIIGTAVKKNMTFGGSVLQDAASLSIANLYMPYFLHNTFNLSNDSLSNSFDRNYIRELKDQTTFNVEVVAVLLESPKVTNRDTNKRFTFNPKLFNPAKRELFDLPEAYVLPKLDVLIKGNDNQVIMPLTKLRFLNDTNAYVWAISVTYDKASVDDELQGFSVKNAISTLTDQELEKCMGGQKGLGTYFNANNLENFTGFEVVKNIATDTEAQNRFERDVEEAFKKYDAMVNPSQKYCRDSFEGIGLITATAMSLNGMILPQVFQFIRK